MKRIFACVVVSLSGCTNFDVLVEQACSGGRCGEGNPIVMPAEPPVLAADKQVLDFGQFTSEAQPKRRLIVSNVDGGLAESLTFNFSGMAADEFSITSSSCSSLGVGQTCPIDVEFRTDTPTLGTRTAELQISASRGMPLVVSLRAEISAALTAPAVLDFGDVAVNLDKVLALRVTNNLPRPGAIAATIPPPFFLDANGNGCATVGIGQSCDVRVRYEAGSSATDDLERTMFLDIEENRAEVRLRARSVQPNQLELGPTQLFATDAGAAVDRSAFRDVEFTVSNRGPQPIKSIEYAIDGGAAWSIVMPACSALGPNETCRGTLRFSPGRIGFHPVGFFADAGPIGADALDAVGRGVGQAALAVTIEDPDSGVSVVQSLDGGRCSTQCTWSTFSDPLVPTRVRLTSQDSVGAFYAPSFSPSSSTCDRLICDIGLTEDVTPLAVRRVRMPFGFVSARTYTGNFDGGLAGADEACALEAADAGYAGQFRALLYLSDGGAGFDRFDAGWFIRENGTIVASRTGDRVLVGSLSQRVWTGRNYSGMYTCGDWTSSSGNGSYEGNGQNYSGCNSGLNLLCLSADSAKPPHAQATVLFATPTSGLGVNFQSECEDAGATLGLSFVRPYYSRDDRATCRSLSFAPDGGSLDAGFAGPVYRLDGARILSSHSRLEDCAGSSSIPPLFAPVGWAVADGGIVPADTRPVRTGPSTTYWTGSGCNNWTSLSSSLSFTWAGNAQVTDSYWFAGPIGPMCSSPSYIYCVGRR